MADMYSLPYTGVIDRPDLQVKAKDELKTQNGAVSRSLHTLYRPQAHLCSNAILVLRVVMVSARLLPCGDHLIFHVRRFVKLVHPRCHVTPHAAICAEGVRQSASKSADEVHTIGGFRNHKRCVSRWC